MVVRVGSIQLLSIDFLPMVFSVLFCGRLFHGSVSCLEWRKRFGSIPSLPRLQAACFFSLTLSTGFLSFPDGAASQMIRMNILSSRPAFSCRGGREGCPPILPGR
jgi:hypothetical protein